MINNYVNREEIFAHIDRRIESLSEDMRLTRRGITRSEYEAARKELMILRKNIEGCWHHQDDSAQLNWCKEVEKARNE